MVFLHLRRNGVLDMFMHACFGEVASVVSIGLSERLFKSRQNRYHQIVFPPCLQCFNMSAEAREPLFPICNHVKVDRMFDDS